MNPAIAFQALELNNRGLDHLLSQHEDGSSHEEAIQEFSQGLKLVKQVLALQEEQWREDEDEDEMDFDFSPDQSSFYFATVPHRQQQHLQAATKDLCCSSPSSKGSPSEPFVFCSPIVVDRDTIPEKQSFHYYVMLSYVLLYNLALTHHLSAINAKKSSNSKSVQKKLKKAVALYELAYQIQSNEGIQLSVLQTMAVVNNLGQIHALLGSMHKSQQCFESLLSAVMIVKDCGQHHEQLDELDASMAVLSNSMDGFLSNCLALMLPNNPVNSIAPAA